MQLQIHVHVCVVTETTEFLFLLTVTMTLIAYISPDKARKGVIYPLKTGIYALVGISERTFTR